MARVNEHKAQVEMHVHRRLKSVCESMQSDQSLGVPAEETLYPWLPIELPLKTMIRLCGCVGRMSLPRVHIPSCTFFWTPNQ